MDESTKKDIFVYVIGPVVAILMPAVIGYVKYKLHQKEKKEEEEKAERNKRRDKIEADIEELKEDVAKTSSIILSCDKPGCPSKVALAEYYKSKYNKSRAS